MTNLISLTAQGKKQLVEVDLANLNANVVLSNVPCDSTVYVGAALIMNASGTAYNALADGLANSNVIGICEEKSSSTICTIRVTGISASIFSGLDVSKEYYLSDITPGAILDTIPTTSGHVRIKLGQPYSSTELLVMKGERVVRA